MNELELNQARQEIIKIHDGIIQSLRRTVPAAIRIGQIITEQKEKLEHGQFLFWVKTLPFDQKTIWRYMSLFKYADKIGTLPNLQSAYKQIESFETIECRKEEERKRQMIQERIKTGVKPEGWDRSCDYEYKKRIEFGGYAKLKEQPPEQQEKQQPIIEDKIPFDLLKEAGDKYIDKFNKIEEFKQKIKLSDNGKDDSFIDAIIEYLSELLDNNRRIEACNNIIKVCRNISIELQQKHCESE